MKQPISKPHTWFLFSLVVTDGLVFGLTDPNSVPSFMLMAGFLLFVLNLYCAIKYGLRLVAWYGLPISHGRRLTRLIVGVTALLVALQSSGELGWRDVIVLFPLAMLSYLYISYGRTQARG